MARGAWGSTGGRMSDPAEIYRAEMGREPGVLPDDDPLGWQWDSRLTNREQVARLLDEPPADEPPVVLPGQESLL